MGDVYFGLAAVHALRPLLACAPCYPLARLFLVLSSQAIHPFNLSLPLSPAQQIQVSRFNSAHRPASHSFVTTTSLQSPNPAHTPPPAAKRRLQLQPSTPWWSCLCLPDTTTRFLVASRQDITSTRPSRLAIHRDTPPYGSSSQRMFSSDTLNKLVPVLALLGMSLTALESVPVSPPICSSKLLHD